MSSLTSIFEKVKEAGWFVLGLGVMVIFVVIIAIFLNGAIYIGEKIIPFLQILLGWASAIFFLILLPLDLIRKTRKVAGTATFYFSYLSGFTLWFYAALSAYYLWGFLGLIVGLFLAGVGVLPIAILASLFNGEWTILWNLLYLAALTYGSRILAIYTLSKVEERQDPVLADNEYQDNNVSITEAEIVSEPIDDDEMYTFCTCGKRLEWKKPDSLPLFCKYCGTKLK